MPSRGIGFDRSRLSQRKPETAKILMLNTAFLLAGIFLLYAGAEGLVRGSASLALRLKLTPLVIGLTVVAFGTSMPEMVVSLSATLSGTGAIAVGNVVGSNIANIALILGLSAILCPLAVHVRIIRIDLPLLLVFSLVFVVMLLNDRIGRIEGALLFAGLIGYTIFSVRSARKEAAAAQQVFADALPPKPQPIFLSIVLIVGGLVLLVVGARLLVTGAVAIAQNFGLSDAVIGLTIVAIGTSLPELATSILAAFKKEGDIAVGNIVGSNMFNILGIAGITSLVRPLENTGMSMVDLALMITLAICLLPLARTGWRVNRWEGAFLLVTYVAYVVYLLR